MTRREFDVLDAITIFVCYLLGGIPFGLLLGLWFKGIDIRQYGSGNLGATNAGRVLGRRLGIAALLLDFIKGFLPVVLVSLCYSKLWAQYADISRELLVALCGAATIAGHVFPVYLKFKGGKGVATTIGVVMAFQPLVGLVTIVVFTLVVSTTRYVSLASIAAAVSGPPAFFLLSRAPLDSELPYLVFFVVFALLILIRHKSNISRLIDGTEGKMSSKKEDLNDIKIAEQSERP